MTENIQVTQEEARQLSREIGQWLACFLLKNIMGDHYTDMDLDWLEEKIAEEALDYMEYSLQPIEQEILTVRDGEKYALRIAKILGMKMNELAVLSESDIRLSTDAYDSYWVDMFADSRREQSNEH